jgi:RNA polymerase sigma factor (sigma-70 family)
MREVLPVVEMYDLVTGRLAENVASHRQTVAPGDEPAGAAGSEWRLAILAERWSPRSGDERVSDPIDGDWDDEVSAAYRAHYPLLAYLACRRFQVPADDVRPIVHEVFVTFLRKKETVLDVRGWLVGAISNRCRLYWRSRGRELAALRDVDVTDAVRPDAVLIRIDVSTALRRMTPRCREILRLRYVDFRSSADIARYYHTTVGYARKLVAKCAATARTLLQQVRDSYE